MGVSALRRSAAPNSSQACRSLTEPLASGGDKDGPYHDPDPSLDITELVRAALFEGSACEVTINNDLGTFIAKRTDLELQMTIRYETTQGSGERVVQCDQRSLNFGKRMFFDCPKIGKRTTKLYVADGELASAEALNLLFPSRRGKELVSTPQSSARRDLVVAKPRGLAPIARSSQAVTLREVENGDRFGDYRLRHNDGKSTEVGCQNRKPRPLTIDQLIGCDEFFEKERAERSVNQIDVHDKLPFRDLPQINIAALSEIRVFKVKPGCTLKLEFLAKFGPPQDGRVKHHTIWLDLLFDVHRSRCPVMRFIVKSTIGSGFRVGEIELLRIERRWYFICPQNHRPTRTLHLHAEGMLASFKGLAPRDTAYQRKPSAKKAKASEAF